MKELTKKQNEIFAYITEEIQAGRPVPSVREVTEHFGFRSTKATRDHFNALERKGMIKREAGKARSIQLIVKEERGGSNVSVPLIGSIPAGLPEYEVEQAERLIQIDTNSLGFKPKGKIFALKVHGDSMIGHGIYDNDIVIVDSSKEPRNGDVVAALIDNEVTLKTFVKNEKGTILRPENPNYSELIPADELLIQGVARTLIRTL